MDFKLWVEILMKKGFIHNQRIIFKIQNLLSISTEIDFLSKKIK